MQWWTNPDRSKTIVGLHYVRALATMMVVAVHANVVVALPKYFGQRVLNGFFAWTAGEIDLFFIMSGVMMVIATHRADTGLPRIGLGEFFRRRAVRLVPMLWTAVLAFNIVYAIGRQGMVNPWESLRSMFFWPVGTVVPFVAWTIRYEVLFYLIFGLCFIAFRSFRWVGIAWFLSPLVLSILAAPPQAEDGTFLHFLLSPFALEFGAGVALGYIFLRDRSPIRFRHQLVTIIALMFAIRIGVYFLGARLSFGSTPFVLVMLPLCAGIVAIALKCEPVRCFAPLILIGDASYSIFLFHPHVVSPTVHVLSKLAPWLNAGCAAGIATAVAVGIGIWIHRLVETPLVRFANTRFQTVPSSGFSRKAA